MPDYLVSIEYKIRRGTAFSHPLDQGATDQFAIDATEVGSVIEQIRRRIEEAFPEAFN
jgi:hypothetical protein